jgi:hypothetical protein
MPAPGDVNNPSGSNGTTYFDGFGAETSYGTIKRLEQNTRAAPTQTPKRRQGKPQPAAQALPPAMPTEIPYGVELAQIWAEAAASPEASELVRYYATEAARGRQQA